MDIVKKNLLFISDAKNENNTLITILENFNYKVILFSSKDDKNILNDNLELSIIDLENISNMELIKNIPSDIPKIFLTSSQSVQNYLKTNSTELIEYIYLPIKKDELIKRVNQLIWIKELQNELKSKSVELEKNKLTDPITNLYNYDYLLERFDEEIMRARRYSYPISCIMIDVDNFEMIEKRYKENTANLLRETALVLKKKIRVVDIIGYYKKGCFLIILPQTISKGAYILGERIRDAIENNSFIINNIIANIKVSISITGDQIVDKENFLYLLQEGIEKIRLQGGNKVLLTNT